MKLNILLGALVVILTLSAIASAQSHNVEQTRIEADPVASEIRLIVNNKTVARLTDTGIIVNGSIIYTGTLRDAPEAEAANE